MGIDYRDYGIIREGNSPKEMVKTPTSQVYKATHDRDGNRLPYRYRSFISFSYGEKLIEDFGLIATTDGDRLNRSIYSKFDDVTETHETLDGQIYWGTYLTNNELNLTLSTDGITARQLDDFKQWFAPGKVRELILMEHPNRAIMARVSEPPQISMLPFKTEEHVKILGEDFTTEVTLFKGDISLSLVMDEPFWYAKNNIIHPFMIKGGANGIINIKDDPYMLQELLTREFKEKDKNLYIEYIENNITHLTSVKFVSMEVEEHGYWEIKCKFYEGDQTVEKTLAYPARKNFDDKGKPLPILPIVTSLYGGAFATLTDSNKNFYDNVDEDAAKDYAKIIYEDNIPHLKMIQDNILLGENTGAMADVESRVYNDSSDVVNNLAPGMGAHVQYYGYVAYDIASWAENVEIDSEHSQYLFYSGTAPSKPTLQFTFSPTFDDNGYVNLPRNSYSDSTITNTRNYDYISFDEHKFCFTTPSLITGYNQAVSIVKAYKVDQSFEELIALLKEKINEYYARAWVMACIKSLRKTEKDKEGKVIPKINVDDSFKADFLKGVKYLFCPDGQTPNPITCFFDSKHGTATVTYSFIRKASGTLSFDFDKHTVANCFAESEVQNAGDMVKSDYLIIEGRNYPSFNGYITKEECHIIQTNFSSLHPLTGLLVTFQNMYY